MNSAISASARATAVLACLAVCAGCGKKGPPLPPLIKLPVAPELKAERRGSGIDLQVTVPAANTDGTRPANVERVDIYAFTGSPANSDDQLVKRAAKIASIDVKAPRDPDDTADPGEQPDAELVGTGLDQGATTHVEEKLTTADSGSRPGAVDPVESGGPLLGPFTSAPRRTYIGVGVNRSGRKGRFSQRVTVSLVPAPPPPGAPSIEYSETAITVSWPGAARVENDPVDSGLLPSRPLAGGAPSISYNVYDASGSRESLLTKTPVTEPVYMDTRIEWGAERCYAVRAVASVAGSSVESNATMPVCRKLVDTFPPAPPKNLNGVAGEGAIDLIWDPNNDKDLAGYIVLRGEGASGELMPVNTEPLQEATFLDKVQAGASYSYAVQAVDTAGNRSQPSNRTEPLTAR